jgi:hypothetical protein
MGSGRAIAQAVSRRLPTTEARVRAWVKSCEIFLVDRVALEQLFSDYWSFPCHSFVPLVAPQSTRAGTVGQ